MIVDTVKGDGYVPPTLASLTDFSTMMECKPESDRCHTVYYVEKNSPEAEFLYVIGTKVLRVFLLAIHSHLY